MKHDAETIVEVVKLLHQKLDGLLAPSLRDSQLFVDLGDIYEVCAFYIETIETIVSHESSDLDAKKIEDIFYKIDVQLLEHLPYHLKSLKKLLPKAIHALQEAQNAKPA